ncbi:hypothetical protein HWV62_1172, partial [Athelia sp. TMB]
MKSELPSRSAWVGRLRSGREFSLFASAEVLHTGKSFADAIKQAAQLDDAGVDSPAASPPRTPASPLTPLSSSPASSSLSSLSTHSMDVPRALFTPSSPGFTSEDLGTFEELDVLSDASVPLPSAFDSSDSSDWFTESDEEVLLTQPLPSSPPRAGKKRKRKIYPSDIAAKCTRRRKKRQREGDALGPTALCTPSYKGTPDALQTELDPETYFPANNTGYSADRVESIRPGHIWTLHELEEMGFDVICWNGRTPITILDNDGRVVAVLVGRPFAAKGGVDGWEEVAAGLEAAINKLEADSTFSEKQTVHRRGPQPAKAFGVSHGGGQKRPSVLDQGSLRNQRAAQEFCKNKYVRRVAHFGSSESLSIARWHMGLRRGSGAFAYYGPKLYARYCDYFSRLRQHDLNLIWNFPRSVFPATTINFGPSTTCYDHLDYGNAAAGWCSITAVGSYDHKRGGHLILFDIDKAVEFPPGSTVLIPSSVMRHGNTPIQEGETRLGMTQYAAGALFRYVDHGFKLQDDASAQVRARVQAGAKTRYRDLLALYSRLDSLEEDRRSAFSLTVYVDLFMAPRHKRKGNDGLWNHDEVSVAAGTLELSRDGKRVRWDTTQIQPTAPLAGPSGSQMPSPESPHYLAEDSSLPYDDNVPLQSQAEDGPPVTMVQVTATPKCYANS